MPEAYLDDTTFRDLRELVQRISGIHFDDNKRYLLEGRVRRRALHCGLPSAEAYLELLGGAAGAAEREALIGEVTTNETSFFRHSRQIDRLRQLLVEQIDARRTTSNLSLSIWSAACSSGEEPFTVAILLCDLIDDIDAWDICILASDISAEHVQRAESGVFTERQLRSLPEAHRRHVEFDADGAGRLSKQVRQLVHFEVANLVDVSREPQSHDIVLCRNALIYFDANTRIQVLKRLHRGLRPGGVLILGPSDALHGVSDLFDRTPSSTYNFYARASEDATPPTPALPVSERKADSRPAMPAGPKASAGSLQSRMLALRMDHGLQALGRDLDSSVARALESVIKAMEELDILGQQSDLAPSGRAAIGRMVRHLDRTLRQLQVGDRGQQKVEALRALLQEMLDRDATPQQEPVDLGVQPSRFDPAILDEDATDGDGDDRQLSQDEIDALFD